MATLSAFSTTITHVVDDQGGNVNVANAGAGDDATPTLQGTLGGSTQGAALAAGERLAIYRAPDMSGAVELSYNTNGTTSEYQMPSSDGNGISYSKIKFTTDDVNWSAQIKLPTNPTLGMLVELQCSSAKSTALYDGNTSLATLDGGSKQAVFYQWNGSAWVNALTKVGNAKVTTTARGQSTWSFTDTLTSNGTFNYEVRIEDAAGNSRPLSAPYTYTLDSVAPAAPTLALGKGVSGGATSTEATQADGVVTVIAEKGASTKVTFSRTNGGKVTKTVIGTGSAQAVVLSAADLAKLGNGTINVKAVATDAASNASAAGVTSFTLDTTGPTVSSVAISSASGAQNNTLNAGDVVTATVTMSEAVTVVGNPTLKLNIDGTVVYAAYASGSGSNKLSFTYTIASGQTDANGISIDANSLSLSGATIRDTAGNNATITHAAAADNASYLVDTTAPAVPTLALGAGVSNGAARTEATQASGVVTVNAESGSIIDVTLIGSNNQSVSKYLSGTGSPIAVKLTDSDLATLGDGKVNVWAIAKDAAGNVSTSTDALPFTLDTTIAGGVMFQAANTDTGANHAVATGSVTKDTTLLLSGTAEAGSTVTIYDGSTLLGTATLTNKVWTYTTNALGQGAHNFKALITDAAGNQSYATSMTPSYVAKTVDRVFYSDYVSFTDGQWTLAAMADANGYIDDGSLAPKLSTGVLGTVQTLSDVTATFSLPFSDRSNDGFVINVGSQNIRIGTLWSNYPNTNYFITGPNGLNLDSGISSNTSVDVDVKFATDGSAQLYLGNVLKSTFAAGTFASTDNISAVLYKYTENVAGTLSSILPIYRAGQSAPSPTTLDVTVDTSISTTFSPTITNVVDNQGTTSNVANGGLGDDYTPTLQGNLGGSTQGAALAADEQLVVYRAPDMTGAMELSYNTYETNQIPNGFSKIIFTTYDANWAEKIYLPINDPTKPLAVGTVVELKCNSSLDTALYFGDTQLERLSGYFSGGTGQAVFYQWNGSTWVNALTKVGNATVTTVAGGQSTWSYTDTLASDGLYNYEVRIEDAAGNTRQLTAPYVYTFPTIAQQVSDLMSRLAVLEAALKIVTFNQALSRSNGTTLGSTQNLGGVSSLTPVSSKELNILQTFGLSVAGRSVDQISKGYYSDGLKELLSYTDALSTFRAKSRLRNELQAEQYVDPLITAKLVVGAVTWGMAAGTVLSFGYLATFGWLSIASGFGVLSSLAVVGAGMSLMGSGLFLGMASGIALAGALGVGTTAAVVAAISGATTLATLANPIPGDELLPGAVTVGALGVAGAAAVVGVGSVLVGLTGLALLGTGAVVAMAGLSALAFAGTAFAFSVTVGIPLSMAALTFASVAWAGLTIAETVLYAVSADKLHQAASNYRQFLQQNGRDNDLDRIVVEALEIEAEYNELIATLNIFSFGLLGVFGGLIVQSAIDAWAERKREEIRREYGSYENYVNQALEERFKKELSSDMRLAGEDMLLRNSSIDRVIMLASLAVDRLSSQSLNKIGLGFLNMSVLIKSIMYDRMLGEVDISTNISNGTFYSNAIDTGNGFIRLLGGNQYITTYGWLNSKESSVWGRQLMNYIDGYANTTLDVSDMLIPLNGQHPAGQSSEINMRSGDDTVIAGFPRLYINAGYGYDGVDYSGLYFAKYTSPKNAAAIDLQNGQGWDVMISVRAISSGGYIVTKGSDNRASYVGKEVEESGVLVGRVEPTKGKFADNLYDVEWIKGSNYNDHMEGIANRYNTFMGSDGNDTLIGGNAGNALSGGAGNDSLIGGTGDDYFFSSASSWAWSPLLWNKPIQKPRGRYFLIRYESGENSQAPSSLNVSLIGRSALSIQDLKFKNTIDGRIVNGSYVQIDFGSECDIDSFSLPGLKGIWIIFISTFDMSAFAGNVDYVPGLIFGQFTGNNYSYSSQRDSLRSIKGTDDSDFIDGKDGNNMVSYQALSNELWRQGQGSNGSDLGIVANMQLGYVLKVPAFGNNTYPPTFKDTLKNIQVIEGTLASDYFLANEVTGSKVLALNGADTLIGGTAADYLDGGDGDDYISAGLGADMIITGAGKDTVLAGGGDDTISVGHAPVLRARYLYLRRPHREGVDDFKYIALKEIEVTGRSTSDSGSEKNLMRGAKVYYRNYVERGYFETLLYNDGLYDDVYTSLVKLRPFEILIDLGAEYDISSINLISANSSYQRQSESSLVNVYASTSVDFLDQARRSINFESNSNVWRTQQSASIQAKYLLIRIKTPVNKETGFENYLTRTTINGYRLLDSNVDHVLIRGESVAGNNSSYWTAVILDDARIQNIRTLQLDLPGEAVLYFSEKSYADYITKDAGYLTDQNNFEESFQGVKFHFTSDKSGFVLTAADLDPSLSKSSFTPWDFFDYKGQSLASNPNNWTDIKYIDGGQGSDTVRYEDVGSNLRLLNAWGVNVNLSDSAAQYLNGLSSRDVLRNVENVIGTAASDSLIGNDAANVLQGMGGNDTLDGGAGNDVLVAGTGANVFKGGAGDDVLAVKDTLQVRARYVMVRKIPNTGDLDLNGVRVMSGGTDVAARAPTWAWTKHGSAWALDLGQEYVIDAVELQRNTASPNKLFSGTDLGVFFSTAPIDMGLSYTQLRANTALLSYEDRNTFNGRYVMVRRTTANRLAVAELAVWSGGVNVARNAKVITSIDGTYLSDKTVSDGDGVDPQPDAELYSKNRVNDGSVTNGTYLSLYDNGNSWVVLDLGKAYDIDAIQVWGGEGDWTGYSSNAQILVSANVDLSRSTAALEPSQVASDELLGRDDVYWANYGVVQDKTRLFTRRDFKNLDNSLSASLTLTSTDLLTSVNWTSPPSVLGFATSRLDGGAGTDMFTLAESAVDWRYASGDGAWVDLQAGMYKASRAAGKWAGPVDPGSLASVEQMVGTVGDDVLLGDAADNYISGDAGNDVLDGRAGNDVLDGGSGQDTLLGGDGNDALYVGHAMRGRYVMVRLTAAQHLSVGELEVWAGNENVARKNGVVVKCSADGAFDENYFAAKLINDGSTLGLGYISRNADGNSWVMLDLGQIYNIDSLKIHTLDPSGNVQVLVASTDLSLTNGNLQALKQLPSYVLDFNGTTDSGKTLNSSMFRLFNPNALASRALYVGSGLHGRYVLVRRTTAERLSVGELEVISGGVNVALNAKVVVSSDGTYCQNSSDSGLREQYQSKNATDGQGSGEYLSDGSDGNSWMMVDLGKAYDIDDIKISGRWWSVESDNLQVFVASTDLSLTNGSFNALMQVPDICMTNFNASVANGKALNSSMFQLFNPNTFANGLHGRYVMVRRTTAERLGVAELEVWVGNENVALNAKVITSTDGTYLSDIYVSDGDGVSPHPDAEFYSQNRVNDGSVTNGTYLSRYDNGNSWVMLDLGKAYDIDDIKISGRWWSVESDNLQVFVASTDLSLTNGSFNALMQVPDICMTNFNASVANGKALNSSMFQLFNPNTLVTGVFDGGNGNDTLSYVGSDASSRSQTTVGVLADLTAQKVVRFWSNTSVRSLAGQPTDTLVGIENLQGSVGNDLIMGSVDSNQLNGDKGNDTLLGADGDDVLSGGQGDDLLEGGVGDDVLYSGDGNDTLRGGDGKDVLLVQHDAPKLRARYVMVHQQPGTNAPLVLDEIQVMSGGINVARSAAVLATESLDNGWYDKSNVIDGFTDSALGQNQGHGVYTSKSTNGQAWLQLDLGAEFDIDSVNISGSAEVGKLSQNGRFGVFLSRSDWQHLAGQYTALKQPSDVTWSEPSTAVMKGRYVLVRRSTADRLAVQEIQVMSGGINVVRNTDVKVKVVTSSDGSYAYENGVKIPDPHNYVAGLAIDGLTNGGHYLSQNNDGSSWLMLDLGKSYNIDSVKMWGKSDSNSQNLQVFVSNNDLSSTDGKYSALMQASDLYVSNYSAAANNGQALSLASGQFSQINASFTPSHFIDTGTQLTRVEVALNRLAQFKTLDGGAGLQDMVSFAAENTAERLSTGDAGRAAYGVRASLTEGFYDIAWRAGDSAIERNGSLSDVEGLIGTQFDDALLGNAQDNTLSGGEGNDWLDGAGGNDVLVGGVGADTLLGGEGDDSFVMSETRQFMPVRYVLLRTGSSGAQRLSLTDIQVMDLQGRNVLMRSGVKVTTSQDGTVSDLHGAVDVPIWVQIDLGQNTYLDRIRVGQWASTDLTVYASGQELSKMSDAKLLTYGSGAVYQSVWEGAGSIDLAMNGFNSIDQLGRAVKLMQPGLGDSIDGGAGTDVLDYSLKYADVRQQLAVGVGVALNTVNGASDGIVRVWNGSDDGATDKVTGVEQIIGTDMADVMRISGSAAMAFRGGAGNDTLTGGDGNDTLNGGSGADVISAGAGDDTMVESGHLPILQGRYVMLRGLSMAASDIQIWINGQQATGAVTANNSAGEPEWEIDLGKSAVIDTLEVRFTPGQTWSQAQAQSVSVFVADMDMLGVPSTDLQANVNVARYLGTTTPDTQTVTSRVINGLDFEVANQLGGGAWNTFVKLSSLSTADTIDGGAGNDWLRFEESEVGARAVTGRGIALDLSKQSMDLWWQLNNSASNPSPALSPSIANIENVRGTLQNDWLVGNEANNVLLGDAGHDTLMGGAGDDILIDGSGLDSMDGGAGNDILVLSNPVASSGQELLKARYVMVKRAASTASTGRNLVTSGVVVRSSGQVVNGTVSVSDGSLSGNVYTSAKDDGSSWYLLDLGALTVIDSVQMNNTATTSPDFDVYLAQSLPTSLSVQELLNRGDVAKANGSVSSGQLVQSSSFWRWSASGQYGLGATTVDTVVGGDGRDMLNFSQSDNEQRLHGAVTHGVWVDLTQQKALTWWNRDVDGVNPNTTYAAALSGIEDVQGSVADDYLVGNAEANTLYGGKGNDTLMGGVGTDIYYFGSADGADIIVGTQGNDAIVFNNEVTPEGIWLTRSSLDLTVKILGSGANTVTVKNFFNASPDQQISDIRFSNGKGLSYTAISNLANAMAQYHQPAGVTIPLTPAYSGLNSLITSSLK